MAKRWPGEINAGSMADIAFLILIYFLMTTTMEVEEGIPQKLPPGKIEDIFTKINERDVFEIIINGQNEIMVEEEKLHDVSLLKEKVKEFLTNPENKAALPQLDEVTVFIARDSIVRLKAELQVLEQNEPQSSLISVKKAFFPYGRTGWPQPKKRDHIEPFREGPSSVLPPIKKWNTELTFRFTMAYSRLTMNYETNGRKKCFTKILPTGVNSILNILKR